MNLLNIFDTKVKLGMAIVFQLVFLGCSNTNFISHIGCNSQEDLNRYKESFTSYVNNSGDNFFIVKSNEDSTYIKIYDVADPIKERNLSLEYSHQEDQFLLNGELYDYSKIDSVLQKEIYKSLSTSNNSGLAFEIIATTKNKKNIDLEQAFSILTLMKKLDCIINNTRKEIALKDYNKEYSNLDRSAKKNIDKITPKIFYVYKQNLNRLPRPDPNNTIN